MDTTAAGQTIEHVSQRSLPALEDKLIARVQDLLGERVLVQEARDPQEAVQEVDDGLSISGTTRRDRDCSPVAKAPRVKPPRVNSESGSLLLRQDMFKLHAEVDSVFPPLRVTKSEST